MTSETKGRTYSQLTADRALRKALASRETIEQQADYIALVMEAVYRQQFRDLVNEAFQRLINRMQLEALATDDATREAEALESIQATVEIQKIILAAF